MKRFFLILFYLCAIQIALSQKPLRKYESYSQFMSQENDVYTEMTLYSGLVLRFQSNPDGNGEYFVESDTSYRFYIHTDVDIMVDSLVLNEWSEYALNFQPLSLFFIRNKKCTFMILEAYDGYQMGTDAQPVFIVFKQDKSSVNLHSVYQITDLEDNSETTEQSIKVFIRNNRLFLKGKNLERIRDYDINTL